jgi:MFS family permease
MTTLLQRMSLRMPALGSRDFVIFWLGQFISLIGTWMQSVTLPYLTYRLTGSSLALGAIGFAVTLPTLFLALPGGVLVERLDKRKTVIWLQVVMMLQAFVMAYLTLSGKIQIQQIIILSFILGAASAIEITARQAMLVELVGKPALPNAIALQSTIFNTARVVGPLLVAPFLVILPKDGEGWAFLFNAISYLFVIVGLLFVHTPYRAAAPPRGRRNLTAEFREGMRYIANTQAILLMIIMAAVIGFFGFPFTQQIPALAHDMLGAAGGSVSSLAASTSALYAAQGVGALIAAVYLSVRSGVGRMGRLLLIGQMAYCLSLTFISAVRSLPPALALIGILGWGTVIQLAIINTLIQLDVPDHLRGRVFSVYLWALQGVAPFGSLAVGWMAQNWGVAASALVGGLICLAVVGLVHLRYPVVRQLSGAMPERPPYPAP